MWQVAQRKAVFNCSGVVCGKFEHVARRNERFDQYVDEDEVG